MWRLYRSRRRTARNERRFLRKSTLLLAVFLVALTTLGFSCTQQEVPQGRYLDVWFVYDDTSDFEEITAAYSAQHPYVRFNLRKLTWDEYEDALVEGWALGEGPDVFAIPNAYVKKYQEFTVPAPDFTESYLVETSGNSSTVTAQQTTMLTPTDVQRFFMDTVAEDVIVDNSVYGLPLAMDTLGLYYNKTLLAQAGVALPAATWQDVVDHASAISLQDSKDNLVRSGIALGTTNNIPRSVDILSVLMQQNGATMVSEDGSTVRFTRESETTPGYFPGRAALTFYTDFAKPTKKVYSWNEEQPNALEEFISGNLAYFIGYSYQYDDIVARAPGLNFDVTNLPQVGTVGRVDYPNYWVWSVASASEYQNDAWDFVHYLVSTEQATKYLETTGQPPALKSLVDVQSTDPVLGIFARQGLTAKSWYHGNDPATQEAAFKEMIDLVNEGELGADEALKTAADKIQLTLE